MNATYIDVNTGQIASESGVSPFDMAENNWSCDCNRRIPFNLDEEDDHPNTCCSDQRFVLVEYSYETSDAIEEYDQDLLYTLEDYNAGYDKETCELAYKMYAEYLSKNKQNEIE